MRDGAWSHAYFTAQIAAMGRGGAVQGTAQDHRLLCMVPGDVGIT